jgi:hypothetical protein
LPLFIKGTPEGGLGAFCFLSLTFALEDFLGFDFWLLLWAFWCGKLLEGKKITERKKMAKEGLIENLHREL